MRNIWILLLSTLAALEAQTAPPASAVEQLTIEQAVAEAIEHNLDLLAERYNVSIAETRSLTARLRPNPVLTVEGDHLDLLGTGYNSVNAAGPAEASIRTDFILERGGKRRDRMEVAEGSRSVAQLAMLNTVRSLVFDVQSAFLDVLLAKEQLALARENLQALNGIVEVNVTRVKAGDLADVELVRSRLAALQFQNAVWQAELRLRTARNRLQFLLGRTVLSETFDASGELRREAEVPALPALRAAALARRPDRLAVVRDQARSAAELRLQIAQGKVDYSVGTEYRRQQGLGGTGNSLGFFFSAPLPVFNRNQGEIERARREQQQSETRLRAASARISNEVENAYQAYSTARTLLDSIEKNMLQQAREVREITEYSYRRGEATLIEFLDAERAFNETMQAYNDARAEYARSLYLIDSVTSLGGS